MPGNSGSLSLVCSPLLSRGNDSSEQHILYEVEDEVVRLPFDLRSSGRRHYRVAREIAAEAPGLFGRG